MWPSLRLCLAVIGLIALTAVAAVSVDQVQTTHVSATRTDNFSHHDVPVNIRPSQEVPKVVEVPPGTDMRADAQSPNGKCQLFQNIEFSYIGLEQCQRFCLPVVERAKKEGQQWKNWGCVHVFPLDQPIPWEKDDLTKAQVVEGECNCNDWFANEIMTTVLEAMPMIAQIGCYMLMSALKVFIDVGSALVPGPLRPAIEMASFSVNMANFIYDKDQDPAGAFDFWLSPCGHQGLVPDDIKNIFDVLSMHPVKGNKWKAPEKIKRASGKKGDLGNPRGEDEPRRDL